MDQKDVLKSYLQRGREALLWKLDGLSERQLRTPLTPTGTNLLGVVKHVAGTEAEYFGTVFGRPFPEPMPWMTEDSEPNDDMWATADQSADWVRDLYRRVWAHSDATIDELELDHSGTVPWWPPERRQVSLQQILAHVIAETHRHAGHVDIVRELIDSSAGMTQTNSNLPGKDQDWWAAYLAKVRSVADGFPDER
jgi:uncharacterized damage-inducible protein DinB